MTFFDGADVNQGPHSTAARLIACFAAAGLLIVLSLALDFIGVPQAALFFVAVFAVVLCGTGVVWVRRHFTEVERLRGAVAVLLSDPAHRVLPAEGDQAGGELAALHNTLGQYIGRLATERAAPDERLRDVVAAVGGGLLVITENGLVSVINDAARDTLGEHGTNTGTTIYDVFTRHTMAEARAKAASNENGVDVELQIIGGRLVRARYVPLVRHGGAVLWFQETGPSAGRHVELALDLHDLPPPAATAGPDTPLADLSVAVIDTETTGLNAKHDRVLSYGSVRVHGTQVYRALTQDLLVNPGVVIPKRSVAVHGITDAMVSGAPDFAERWPAIETSLEDLVVVGHNIGFDATVLVHEVERIGSSWHPPSIIDTLLLAAALDPARKDLSLDGLAEEFGITIEGRHTALGDALVTAELYIRLVDALAAQGVTTLGEAIAFGAKRSDLVREQQARGWLTP